MKEAEHWCETCHGMGKHLPGCPEYEPEPTGTCDLCGAEIYLGDRVVRYDGLTAHSECFLEKYEKEEE